MVRFKRVLQKVRRRWHWWVLAVVVLYEALLATKFVTLGWELRTPEYPLTLNGERLVIYGDGLGYYAWLRSLVIDGDWNFENEFDEHNPRGDGVPWAQTDLGRRKNPYSVGPACLWAPAVVLTHTALRLGPSTRWPADGYSLPYQIAVGITGFLVAMVTLSCLYGICRVYSPPGHAALAVAFLTLGTTLLDYSAIEMTMGHGAGAAAMALLVWYWLRTYGSSHLPRWMGVGALVGLAALMRWQLAAMVLLPVGECLLDVWRDWRRGEPLHLLSRAAWLALMALGAMVIFLPQMIAWKVVYGSWLTSPMPLNHNWWRPNLTAVLFGTNRSFFYWTPLTLFPLLGYLLWLRPARRHRAAQSEPREPLALLLLAFATQVYLLASITGLGVFLGSAFGYRQLTESVVLLAPGLTLLLRDSPPKPQRWLLMILLLLTTWNIILMAEYHVGLLPQDGGANPAVLLHKVHDLIRFVRIRPDLGIIFLLGPALLAVAVLWHCIAEKILKDNRNLRSDSSSAPSPEGEFCNSGQVALTAVEQPPL